MSLLKKLTEDEIKLKDALNMRVLSLYRQKRNLQLEMDSVNDRISHLEEQISNIGGPGTEIKIKTDEQ